MTQTTSLQHRNQCYRLSRGPGFSFSLSVERGCPNPERTQTDHRLRLRRRFHLSGALLRCCVRSHARRGKNARIRTHKGGHQQRTYGCILLVARLAVQRCHPVPFPGSAWLCLSLPGSAVGTLGAQVHELSATSMRSKARELRKISAYSTGWRPRIPVFSPAQRRWPELHGERAHARRCVGRSQKDVLPPASLCLCMKCASSFRLLNWSRQLHTGDQHRKAGNLPRQEFIRINDEVKQTINMHDEIVRKRKSQIWGVCGCLGWNWL